MTTTPEARLLQGSDEAHLAYAISQGHVLVTQDVDFLRIVATGREIPGIAFYPAQGRSIGQVIRTILLIWELCEPEELRDRVEYL